MCVYRCVYSTSAVSMPVHNWCCAGNLHICKLPVYSQTSSHKHSKSTNRPDTALAETCQDKQHPTSKLGSLFFFLSALPLPLTCLLVSASFFPLCSLFFFVPFIFHLYHFILSLLCPSHHPSCSLPFAPPLYPSPVHHSQQFLSPVTPFSSSFLNVRIQYLLPTSESIQFSWDSVKNNCIFMSAHNNERRKKVLEGYKHYVKAKQIHFSLPTLIFHDPWIKLSIRDTFFR